MTPDLSRRIGRAFTAGSATLAERDRLIKAAADRTVQTAEDLSPVALRTLVDLEVRGGIA